MDYCVYCDGDVTTSPEDCADCFLAMWSRLEKMQPNMCKRVECADRDS